jgi:hypothetical protein
MPHPQSHHERRRTPRVDVSGRIQSRLEPSAQDVVVRDLSLGGFLIESPSAFPVDAVHHFRVALKDGEWTTVLTAKSVHCHERTATGGAPTYLTGFAFVEPQGPDAQRRLHELMNKATSVVRF